MLSGMIQELGYRHHPFVGGRDFLDSIDHLQNGCVLVDLRMPDMDGLAVLERLAHLGRRLPAILITGQGDIASSVSAMKLGANDVLLKPFSMDRLAAALDDAFAALDDRGTERTTTEIADTFSNLLTARQRDVLAGMIDGKSNKEIAQDLGIAARTVEMHRAHLMEKLGVRNLAEVLKLVMQGDTAKRSKGAIPRPRVARARDRVRRADRPHRRGADDPPTHPGDHDLHRRTC